MQKVKTIFTPDQASVLEDVSRFDTKNTFPYAFLVHKPPEEMPIRLSQGFKSLIPNGTDGYLPQGAIFIKDEEDVNNAKHYRGLSYSIFNPRNRFERAFRLKYHYHRFPTPPFRKIYWEFGSLNSSGIFEVLVRWNYKLPHRDCDTPPERWVESRRNNCPLLTGGNAGTTWGSQFGVIQIFDFKLLKKLVRFKKASNIYEAYENYLKYGFTNMAVPNCIWKQVVDAAPMSVCFPDGDEITICNWVDAQNDSDFKRKVVAACPDKFDVEAEFDAAEAAENVAREKQRTVYPSEAAAAEATAAAEAAAAAKAKAATAVETVIREFKLFPYLDKEDRAMKAAVLAEMEYSEKITFEDMKLIMIFRAFRKRRRHIPFALFFKNLEGDEDDEDA